MQQLSARWRALGSRQRALAGGIVLAAFAAILLAVLAQRDTRIALYAVPLHGEQVSEVVQRLAEWNVAFVAMADNVRIDARRRNELLLRLSLAGVPHPHRASSSEALEKINPLVPQSVLDAQQREGLTGDLASALRGIAGVEDAQVLVAPARSGGFADEAESPASAGVRLRMRPGARLANGAVDGIRQFVADSVSGLDPKRVAILDDRGLALGSENRDGDEQALGLQASLQSELDQAFGAGATIVRVRFDYDSRIRDVRNVRRTPLAGHSIATATVDEHYSNDHKRYSKVHSSEDRGSDVREERTQIPGGALEYVSASVAVDASRKLDLNAIRALASASLGLMPNRDRLEVQALPFVHAAAATHSVAWAAIGLAASLAPPCLIALTLLLVLRWGSAPAARMLETVLDKIALRRTSRAVATYAPAHVRGALRDEPPHTAAAIISALPAATASAVLEMYSPEERAAIVRRMQREAAPAVPNYETVLRRG